MIWSELKDLLWPLAIVTSRDHAIRHLAGVSQLGLTGPTLLQLGVSRPVGRISKLEGPALQNLGVPTTLFILFWPKVWRGGLRPPCHPLPTGLVSERRSTQISIYPILMVYALSAANTDMASLCVY